MDNVTNSGVTYTPAGGTTPQAQATQSLAAALNQIQGLAPSAPAGQLQANAQNFANAEPSALTQLSTNLQNEAGIPQLQSQQANLGQIFQMYLADQNLAQQYSSPTLNTGNSPVYNNPNLTPQTGIYTGIGPNQTNPYLASPASLVNAVTQPAGQGFQGFTTPTQNTSAMGVVPSSASSLIQGLSGLIGQENSLVSSGLSGYANEYNNEESLLNNLASIAASEGGSELGPGGYPLGSSQELGYTQGDILNALGPYATPTDVWNYLNAHQSDITNQLGQETMNQLWAWQKDLNQKIGANGSVVGGKIPKPATSTDTVTPIKSTAAGKTSLTGWTIKLKNGSSMIVKRPDTSGLQGLLDQVFDRGALTSPAQTLDPTQVWSALVAKGYSDQQIIAYLKAKGFTVQ